MKKQGLGVVERFFKDLPKVRLLLLISGIAALFFLGTRGLYETTEGRYAECAREMAAAGSWLEPVLNGVAHWTKPPLTYLAIKIPYQVLGPTTWAARYYLLFCYLIAIWATWRLARSLWRDDSVARLCALVYASFGMPMLASQTTTTDYPLAAGVAVAQVFFWEAFRSRARRAVYAMWFFWGVAFLTKGPPALLFLPAVIVTWLRLPKAERRACPLFSPLPLLLFLVVGFGWYAWEAYRHPGLLNYWWGDEVINRSFSGKFKRNPEFYQNFVIYLPAIAFGTLPWSVWLMVRWRRIWQRIRLPTGIRGFWNGLSDEALWLMWAIVFPLGVFMLSRSKLPFYLLPLFVPFAAWLGKVLMDAFGKEPWFTKRVVALWCVTVFLFVVSKGVYAYYPSQRDMALLQRRLAQVAGVKDASHLASLGDKPLNGLSYYFDREVERVPMAELPRWVARGGRRYLICSAGHRGVVMQSLTNSLCSASERRLTEKWLLVTVENASATNSAVKP